jgi:hypothetical protein
MGKETFSGPLQVGPRREGTNKNVGDVLLVQTATVDHTETAGTTQRFLIPKNARLVGIAVSGVITGTTPTLSVGTNSGTANDILSAFAITSATAFYSGNPGTAGSKLTNGLDALSATADVPVYIKIGGTGLSLGDITVALEYIMGDNANGAI